MYGRISYHPLIARELLRQTYLDLHDTFGRDIIVYKEAQKVIVSTDPNPTTIYIGYWLEATTPKRSKRASSQSF